MCKNTALKCGSESGILWTEVRNRLEALCVFLGSVYGVTWGDKFRSVKFIFLPCSEWFQPYITRLKIFCMKHMCSFLGFCLNHFSGNNNVHYMTFLKKL
jgi:hypothetical protein